MKWDIEENPCPDSLALTNWLTSSVKQKRHSEGYKKYIEAQKYSDELSLEYSTNVLNKPCCLEVKPG